MKQKEQESLLHEITELITKAAASRNDYEKVNLMTRITMLKGQLDNSMVDTRNIDAKIKSIVEQSQRKQRPKTGRRISTSAEQ